jgi:hypothetical protein
MNKLHQLKVLYVDFYYSDYNGFDTAYPGGWYIRGYTTSRVERIRDIDGAMIHIRSWDGAYADPVPKTWQLA